MEYFYIILGMVGVLIFAILTIAAIKQKITSKRLEEIFQALHGAFPEGIITEENGKTPFQFRLESRTTIYLIKLISMQQSEELIITNPDFWCVNDNPREWNKSSTPRRIPDVKSFREFSFETTKKFIKLGLVYPNCANITKYINESDVEVVVPSMDVYGVRILRLDSLLDFFAQVEKK